MFTDLRHYMAGAIAAAEVLKEPPHIAIVEKLEFYKKLPPLPEGYHSTIDCVGTGGGHAGVEQIRKT